MVIDPQFWYGKRVFLTGHTGFKGAWTALLLSHLGAEVYGFALPPEHDEDLFVVADIERDIHSIFCDIRDLDNLRREFREAQPEIVIHLAAQALVRRSYAKPVDTYSTNVMGTVNILEAVRNSADVKAVVVITSDKCYEDNEGSVGYRETDPLGGCDPYSSSKGCAELVTAAYRNSYFRNDGSARVASVRAGNVIGGGDWALDRLVPDAMRAFLCGETLKIRNASAVRPWQHVLDPVIAYLTLAERLATDSPRSDEAWNIGPSPGAKVTVEHLIEALIQNWGGDARWEHDRSNQPHESYNLRLDCSKSHERLGWHPLINLDQTILLTVEWYRKFQAGADLRAVTLTQIKAILDRDPEGSASASKAQAVP